MHVFGEMKKMKVESSLGWEDHVFELWGYFLGGGSMWCWIWSKSYQVVIFNSIISMQNKAHTSSMMFHNLKQWFYAPCMWEKLFFYTTWSVQVKKKHIIFSCVFFSVLRFSHSLSSFKRPCFTIILCLSSGTPIIS